jgi:hypothetical protein
VSAIVVEPLAAPAVLIRVAFLVLRCRTVLLRLGLFVRRAAIVTFRRTLPGLVFVMSRGVLLLFGAVLVPGSVMVAAAYDNLGHGWCRCQKSRCGQSWEDPHWKSPSWFLTPQR